MSTIDFNDFLASRGIDVSGLGNNQPTPTPVSPTQAPAPQNSVSPTAGINIPTPVQFTPVPVPQVPNTQLLDQISAKYDEVKKASEAKIAYFGVESQLAADRVAKASAIQKQVDNSWAGKAGFSTDGFIGARINDVASLVSGTSRNILGQTLSLPSSVASMANTVGNSEEEYQAWNRYKSNQMQTGDASLLSRVKSNGSTVKDSFLSAEANRKDARSINDFFNLDGIVDPTNRIALNEKLKKGFDEPWAQLSTGIDAVKNGDVLHGGMNAVEGLAKILYNTGDALVKNPAAVREYVIENAPQLLVGAVGKAGALTMTASNIGYAADNYQQGIENYMKENKGQLPDEAQRQRMAMIATSLAVAEHAGDHAGLAFGGVFNKAANAPKVGFTQGMKNIGKAGAEGFASEAATEGYQTWGEGEVTGKSATPLDIYSAAAIGGASGGVLSGGVRLGSELAKATPEHAQIAATNAAATASANATYANAVSTNDVSAFTDPTSSTYSIPKAIGALYDHANLPETTQETKDANVKQAGDLLSKLQDSHQELQTKADYHSEDSIHETEFQIDHVKGLLANATDETKKSALEGMIANLEDTLKEKQDSKLKSEADTALSKSQRMLDSAQNTLDAMSSTKGTNTSTGVETQTNTTDPLATSSKPEVNTSQAIEIAKGTVKTSTPVDTATTEKATKHVMTLSMQSNSGLTAKDAKAVAANTANNLTTAQREHLNAYAATQEAIESLDGIKSVNREIVTGERKFGTPDVKNAGIATWLNRMATAVNTGNTKLGDGVVSGISKFADGHESKLKAMQQAIQYGPGSGVAMQGNTWVAMNPQETKAHNGQKLFIMNTPKGIAKFQEMTDAVAQEVNAINKAKAQIISAHALTFGKTGVVSNSSTAPNNNQSNNNNSNNNIETPARLSETQVTPETKPVSETQAQKEVPPQASNTVVDTNPSAEQKTSQNASNPVSATETKPLTKAEKQAQKKAAKEARREAKKEAAKQGVSEQQGVASATTQVAEDTTVQAADLPKDTTDKTETKTIKPVEQQELKDHLEINKTTDESTPHDLRNLVADKFSIMDTKEKDATERPLVKVANFLLKLKESPHTIYDFILKDEVSEGEAKVLDKFVEIGLRWKDKFSTNLDPNANKAFYYKDMINFLKKEDGTLPANVSTAMTFGAMQYIIENGSSMQVKTKKEINDMLNRDKDAYVSYELMEAISTLGVRQSTMANSIGATVVQALGLKLNGNVGDNLKSKLESSIGNAVVTHMINEGIIQRNEISAAKLQELSGVYEASAPEEYSAIKHYFLSPALQYNEDGSQVTSEYGQPIMTKKAESFFQAVDGGGSILTDLFKTDSVMKAPSLTPKEFNQETTKNSLSGIPKALRKIMNKFSETENYFREDMIGLVRAFDPATLLRMQGYREIDNTVQANKLAGMAGKNLGLERSLENLHTFLESLGDRVTTPFFLKPSVWKQLRVGIDTTMINPQADKLHRNVMTRKNWENTFNLDDLQSTNQFKIQIAAAIGIKVDKKSPEAGLSDFETKINTPEFQAAIKAIQKAGGHSQNGYSVTAQKTIETAVELSGEGMHSLSGLVTYANYLSTLSESHVDDSIKSFTSQMMTEVDGVNNGPILTTLLMGAGRSKAAMRAIMEKGGLYVHGAMVDSYPDWKGTPGNLDMYESLISDTYKNLNSAPNDLAAMYAITGDLMKDGQVTSTGRTFAKSPLTVMMYGAQLKTSLNNMRDVFLEKLFDKMEDTGNKKEGAMTREELVSHLNTMGVTIPDNVHVLNHVFSKKDLHTLASFFDETFGNAFIDTLKESQAAFLSTSNAFNRSVGIAYELYNAVYQAKYQERLQQLVDEGTVPSRLITAGKNKGKREAIESLNAQEVKQLEKELRGLLPKLDTAYTQQTGEKKAALTMAKTSRVTSQDPLYSTESKYVKGQAIKGAGNTFVTEAPGVAMLSASIHSGDSFVSHMSDLLSESLNLHDAKGDGVTSIYGTAQNLNKTTIEMVTNYSPLTAVNNALEHTIIGLALYLKSNSLPPNGMLHVQKALNSYVTFLRKTDKNVTSKNLIIDALTRSQLKEKNSLEVKFEFLKEVDVVSQYAMGKEGSFRLSENPDLMNHILETEKTTLADINARMKSLKDGELSRAIDIVTKAIMTKEEEQQVRITDVQEQNNIINDLNPTDDGEHVSTSILTAEEEHLQVMEDEFTDVFATGISNTPSTSWLVKAFGESKSMTSMEAIDLMLGKPNISPYTAKILQALRKIIDPNLKINLITPGNKEQVMGVPNFPSRAWYASDSEGGHEINMLSPEFIHSGLTPETMVHELLHGALFASIEHGLANPDSQQGKAVASLNDLLIKAGKNASPEMASKFNDALTNVHEFVSYGLTNKEFQDEVLNFKYENKNQNSFTNALKAFISNLTNLLFGYSPTMETALTSLIKDSVDLMANAKDVTSRPAFVSVQSMASTNSAGLHTYNTHDIYQALKDHSNTGIQISDKFDQHLNSVLTSIVEKVYGPFGSFKEAVMKEQGISPEDVYVNALATGKAPHASEAFVAGMHLTDHEAFVFDQVQAVVAHAFSADNASVTPLYREMNKLFQQARKELSAENFYKGDWATATQVEKDNAQNAYDFVFNITPNASGKSDHLARFAALGLSQEQFHDTLSIPTKDSVKTAPTSIQEKLKSIWTSIMDWIMHQSTNTFKGQKMNSTIHALVKQLAQKEAKVSSKFSGFGFTEAMDAVDNVLLTKREAFRSKLGAFTANPMYINSGNAFIRSANAIGSAYAGHRTKAIMEAIARTRDSMFKNQQLGLAAGLLNEVRGATTPLKVMFQFLLRDSKTLEGNRKDIITGTLQATLASFAKSGDDLTIEHKHAITQLGLRTDAQSLIGKYSMDEIQKLMTEHTYLASEIDKVESTILNLSGLNTATKNYYINSAITSGYRMATSITTNRLTMMNANNIVKGFGTSLQSQITEAQANSAREVVDTLMTLRAIKYTPQTHKIAIKEVIANESKRADKGNGLEMVLMSHKAMQEMAMQNLFSDGKEDALFMKGYTPEVLDPYVDFVIADDFEGKELLAKGYTKGNPIAVDPHDPDKTKRSTYHLRDGGMMPWLTGTISYTGERSKGTRLYNNEGLGQSYGRQLNQMHVDNLTNRNTDDFNLLVSNKRFDPFAVKDQRMTPVVNPSGDIVNYRYMMQDAVKNDLLKRDNRFEKVLGVLAGNIYDKPVSKIQNDRVINLLHKQFLDDFGKNSDSYVEVSPTSRDPQLQAIYRMLPNSTKETVKAVWGKESMQVRADLLDLNFGYRKLSVADSFNKEESERNFVENMMVQLGTYAFDKKAPLRVRQAENVWQEIVKMTKSNFVVRSWSTFSGNLRSNFSQLLLAGVPPSKILKLHHEAFKAAWEYTQNSKELFKIEVQLESGYINPGTTRKELEYQHKQLTEANERNPAKLLIDAGLMPTIVDDVAIDQDIYSYKSLFNKKVKGYTDKLNPEMVTAAKWILMTEDTTPYKAMAFATQISDFLARYTLYKHVTSLKENALSHEEAVQYASDAFINYDNPTHRKLQYANDSGLMMFTKYYVRIQRMIAKLFKEHPGRVAALIATEHVLGSQPTVLDSSFLKHFGSPINAGALDFPKSVSNIMTVKAIMSPF